MSDLKSVFVIQKAVFQLDVLAALQEQCFRLGKKMCESKSPDKQPCKPGKLFIRNMDLFSEILILLIQKTVRLDFEESTTVLAIL